MSKKPTRIAREKAGGKSFDGFSLPPHAIVVIGVDTQHGPEHPLYSQRAVDVAAGIVPMDDRMLRSVRAKGVKQPVLVKLERVADNDTLWPPDMRGTDQHVLVAGRHRVLWGRRVVEETETAGDIKDRRSWQIKCTLEHAKNEQELITTIADENMCRRRLGDDEIAEAILRGVNSGLTLEEMADRYDVTKSKAKRLLARAEGVPEKPRKPKIERVPAKAVSLVAEWLRARGSGRALDNDDVANLIDIARGKLGMDASTQAVNQLFREASNERI